MTPSRIGCLAREHRIMCLPVDSRNETSFLGSRLGASHFISPFSRAELDRLRTVKLPVFKEDIR